MLLRRLEKLIDPFRPLPDTQPLANAWRFHAHFLREVHDVLAPLLLMGLLDALIEAVLLDSLGRIADMIQATPSTEFFGRHRSELLWTVFMTPIARSVTLGLHDMPMRQVINSNLLNLIRWQNHHYMLKQSPAFFQNNFVDRIA